VTTRKFLFAAVLGAGFALAGAAPALAQGCGQGNPNCIVATAPLGTSNNQAASTAFVGAAISGQTAASVAAILASANNLAPPLYMFNANTITTPTDPSSPAYQFKFGPPLWQAITDSNRPAIVGQSVQNQSAAAILDAVIGSGVLISAGAGNQVQGMFERAECQAAGGCTGIEIDTWAPRKIAPFVNMCESDV
jgi:hypothetical protein